MVVCTITGEQCEFPVASLKTGTVYEKRVITQYIKDHGADPVTGQPLTLDDLLELNSGETVTAARPPTQTSIPALLSTFQVEWDALTTENFRLRQQLAITRQESSVNSYDAGTAYDLLEKVTKDRDEMRTALARSNFGASAAGAHLVEDNAELPYEILELIHSTQQKLSATRKKRAIPEGWLTRDEVTQLVAVPLAWADRVTTMSCVATAHYSSITGSPKVHAVIGNREGFLAGYFGETYYRDLGSRVTEVFCLKDRIISTHANGAIKLTNLEDIVSFAAIHAGPATDVSVHHSGVLMATVGEDKTYVLYKLAGDDFTVLTRVFTPTKLNCCHFHPDGHILATGGEDGEIRVYDIKTGAIAAHYVTDSPLIALKFSENGIFLASASQESKNVSIWDLRKDGAAAHTKTITFDLDVSDVAWDYTGQYLAIAGGGAVAVMHYEKSGKKWTELMRRDFDAIKLTWDDNGQFLMAVGPGGAVQFERP